MSVEELLKYVPAAAVYHRVPLPDGENALGPWREAIQRLVEPAEDDAAWNRLHDCACHGESDDPHAAPKEPPTADACPAACESPFVFPEGEDGRHLREILETNRPALEWIDQGIERGRLQLPESQTIEDFSKFTEWMAPLRCVAQLLRARAMAGATDGEFDAAGRDLIRILRVGEMLCGGDVSLNCYLSGMAIETFALEQIGRLARLPGVSERVRAELTSAVRRSLARRDELAGCACFEFRNSDLFWVDRFPDGGTLETLVDFCVRNISCEVLWEADRDKAQEQGNEEGDGARLRRYFLFLLEGHPQPFDKAATVRLAGLKVAETARLLSRLRRPWWHLPRLWFGWRRHRRLRWFRRQLAKWPGYYSGRTAWDMIAAAPMTLKQDLICGAATFLDLVGPVKLPTHQAMLRAKKRLRRVDNPLGILFAESLGIDLVKLRSQQDPRAAAAKRVLSALLHPLALSR